MVLTQRAGVRLAAIFLAAAIVIGIFNTVLPAQLRTILTGLETAVPQALLTGGLVLVLSVAAFAMLRDRPGKRHHPPPLVGTEQPPERPQQPPARTGGAFDTQVAETARNVRVRQIDPADTAPRDRLRQTVLEIVVLAEGCSESEAVQRLAEGTWSKDAVACAFLSAEIDYPFVFRVLWWARPETAYERAVARTTTALQSAAREVPGYTAPTVKADSRKGLGYRLLGVITGGSAVAAGENESQTAQPPAGWVESAGAVSQPDQSNAEASADE